LTYDELEKENIKLKAKTEKPNKAEVWLHCYIALLHNGNAYDSYDLENICDKAVRQYGERF